MISYIRGILTEQCGEEIVVETGGVGFFIRIPAMAAKDLPPCGEEVKIHTYLHVKEDLMQLYGFLRREELEMFELMLRVNGIGPKGALSILSGMTADSLRFAILSSDAKTISQNAAGIGVKTAQKMILELKDKIRLEDAFEAASAGEDAPAGKARDAKSEAVLALTALGYANAQALRAVSSVRDSGAMSVEELLKAALKYM